MLRVKVERLRRGWSQTAVSMRTGIAASDVSAVERGLRYPHRGWRRRLSVAFGLSEAELFVEVPDEEPVAG